MDRTLTRGVVPVVAKRRHFSRNLSAAILHRGRRNRYCRVARKPTPGSKIRTSGGVCESTAANWAFPFRRRPNRAKSFYARSVSAL